MANADDIFDQAEDLSADDIFDQAEDLSADDVFDQAENISTDKGSFLSDIGKGVYSAASGMLSGAGTAISSIPELINPETYSNLAEGFKEGALDKGYLTGELGSDGIAKTIGDVAGQAVTGKLVSNVASRLAESPESALRGAAQIPTLGFQDELSAAIGALAPTETDKNLGRTYTDRYTAIRDAERQASTEALQKDPISYFLGGAIASAPQMIAAPGAAAKAGQTLQKVPGLAGTGKAIQNLPTAGKLATVGAGEGALAGAGFSEKTSVSGLTEDIASGSTYGLGLGLIAPAVAATAPKVLRSAKKTANVLRPASRAPGKKVTIEQLKRMNPARAADEIENLNQAGFSFQRQLDDKIAQGEVLNKAQISQQKNANIAFARQLEMRKLPEGIKDAEDFLAGVGGQLRKPRKIIQDGQIKTLSLLGDGSTTKQALGARANKAVQFAKRTFDNVEDAHKQFLSQVGVPEYAKKLDQFDDQVRQFRQKQMAPLQNRLKNYSAELQDLAEERAKLRLEGGTAEEVTKKLEKINQRQNQVQTAQSRLRNQIRLARTQEQNLIEQAGELFEDPRKRFLIDTNELADEIVEKYKKEVFPQLEIGKEDVANDLKNALSSAVSGRRYATVTDLKNLKNSVTNYFDTKFAGEGAKAAKNKAGTIANNVLKKKMDKTVAELANKAEILDYVEELGANRQAIETTLNKVNLDDYLEAKETFFLVNSMGDEVQNAALQGLQAPEISLGQVVSGYVAGAVTQNPFIGIATGLAQGFIEPRFPYIAGRTYELAGDVLRKPASIAKKLGAKDIILKSPQAVEYIQQSTLPNEIKRITLNSIRKSPEAFSANHYVLTNASPQYREFMKELEDRTNEELERLQGEQKNELNQDPAKSPYRDLAVDWEE